MVPDGRFVAVAADGGDGPRIYRVPVTGGTPEQLTELASSNPQWSPDGQTILYDDRTAGGAFFPVRGIRLDKTAVKMPDLSNHGDWEAFRFTPDGNGDIPARRFSLEFLAGGSDDGENASSRN